MYVVPHLFASPRQRLAEVTAHKRANLFGIRPLTGAQAGTGLADPGAIREVGHGA